MPSEALLLYPSADRSATLRRSRRARIATSAIPSHGTLDDTRRTHRAGHHRGRRLPLLYAMTLAVMGIGFAGSLMIWVRGRGAAGGLAALFALGVLRQVSMLLANSSWPLPADPLVLGEISLAVAGVAGLVALRALWKTTRELDRAEDLHWDSMEAVRLLSELAAHPGAGFEQKLARVLELGTARFELEYAVACRLGGAVPEILGWRAPEGGLGAAELVAALELRLRQAADAPRALTIPAEAGAANASLQSFLGAPARIGAEAPWVLAFAGKRPEDARFTATDKDLIGLMAQWLRSELQLRARSEPARRSVLRASSAESALDRHDLNATVRRLEPRLRAQVSAAATLEVSLAASLPTLRTSQIALETLVESLVVAAHDLSPAGALQLETNRLAAGVAEPDGDPYATLSVRVCDASIQPDALARAFAAGDPGVAAPPNAGSHLSLAQLEALLRRSGADLSVQVEPGRGAALTAFLPARRTATAAATHDLDATSLASNP